MKAIHWGVIHWGGGIDLPRQKMLAGWPCCCSGHLAEDIRADGKMNYSNPEEVTCKRCQTLLRKAGKLL